jgi:hypothetical protein
VTCLVDLADVPLPFFSAPFFGQQTAKDLSERSLFLG